MGGGVVWRVQADDRVQAPGCAAGPLPNDVRLPNAQQALATCKLLVPSTASPGLQSGLPAPTTPPPVSLLSPATAHLLQDGVQGGVALPYGARPLQPGRLHQLVRHREAPLAVQVLHQDLGGKVLFVCFWGEGGEGQGGEPGRRGQGEESHTMQPCALHPTPSSWRGTDR